MDCEVNSIIDNLENRIAMEFAMLTFHKGVIYEIETVVVCCGIGKVNSAIATQLLIDRFHVDYIINTGVAGAISNFLEVGDVVISSDVTYHDFNPMQLVKSYPWMNDIYIQADKKLVQVCTTACGRISTINRSYVGRIVSGDAFISDSALKHRIGLELSALCIEMEGASIGHVCYVNKVPFVIIRSISDKANEDASISFREFLAVAGKQSNQLISEIIQELADMK